MIEIWKTLGCVFMSFVMGTGLAQTAESHDFVGMLLFGMAFAFWTNLSLLRIFGDH
ncbi:hypothetical protein KP12_229 [Klebsiella phage KP12]|jgi:hypothetical protein|uniref:Uncharacterized protein n=4 Tax=Vequintavirinae TaxID=1911928 RepID=A0A7L8ZJ73_9CAUD|nr:hypothetical protein BIS47_160 [Klebsiella phage vB_KpnM_BIS47]YP_009859220.1 hypothetical protein HWD29_gp168 [Klebsiella phage KpS8]QOI68744.1 hypothetical protein phage621_00191 [Klebsiella phage vB_KpnM_Seu621]UNI73637.1 hypothetical protein KP12_229 [Klebsiella phage KP12]WJJ58533.1 hypothetical protein NDO71_orf167 [Klebsiella phage vB_KpnM_NDO71]ARB12664.1 hypothetical protein BIS47_160 [Klebsiella phage vB_KpnM_BIS47]QIW88346.1 hypothetical protein kps8_174 [Klebsiella phage KpS8]